MRVLNPQALELARKFAERKKSLRAGAWAMEWLGQLTFGIERVSVVGRAARYVNTGETYDSTIMYSGAYIVSSWGDWLESAEQEYCAENNVTRCAHCSSFTPTRETFCDTCGNSMRS